MQLADMIRQRSLKRGDYTLASGLRSDYLIDLKPTAMHPLGASLIADAILDWMIMTERSVDAFGGLAMGAVPLVSAVVTRSAQRQCPTRGFFVRKASKEYGSQSLIEGCLQAGMQAVLLEDVTTTGGSVLQAAQAVRKFGAHVTDVVTVVDRLEGAADNLREQGITLTALLTRNDILDRTVSTYDNPVHCDADGWWFWIETWAEREGPFAKGSVRQ